MMLNNSSMNGVKHCLQRPGQQYLKKQLTDQRQVTRLISATAISSLSFSLSGSVLRRVTFSSC